MLAKKLLVASIITSLLAGCGGAANQPALPEGDYGTDVLAPSDDFGSDSGDYGNDDPYTGGNGTGTGTGNDTSTGGDTDVKVATYTLKGVVADKNGKGISGVTVTIGSQTMLTDSDGKYEITGIQPVTKVYVSVTKTGYDSLTNREVAFTTDKPSVTQDFKLVLKDTTSPTTEAGLHHKATFASKNFKSVHAMVATGDNVYVLGLLDGLILDSTAVVAFSADTGEVTNSFKKIGWLRSLPKDATSLKLDGDDLLVSNGEVGYSFTAGGEFIKKSGGARYPVVTEVKDTDRSITYKLVSGSSTKVSITHGGSTTKYDLANVGSAKALGLDGDGNLLVLDASNKVVHQFEFED